MIPGGSLGVRAVSQSEYGIQVGGVQVGGLLGVHGLAVRSGRCFQVPLGIEVGGIQAVLLGIPGGVQVGGIQAVRGGTRWLLGVRAESGSECGIEVGGVHRQALGSSMACGWMLQGMDQLGLNGDRSVSCCVR